MCPMGKTEKPIPWLSGGLAAVVAFLFVAVTVPNTDRATVDYAVNPPRSYIQHHPSEVFHIWVLALAPVLCIFILGRRWIVFDWISWFVLAALLVGILGR